MRSASGIANEKVRVDVDVAVDNPIGYFSIVRSVTFNIPEGARPGEYEVFVGFDRTDRAPASALRPDLRRLPADPVISSEERGHADPRPFGDGMGRFCSAGEACSAYPSTTPRAGSPEEQRVSAAVSPEVEHLVFYFSVLVSFLGLAIRWITVGFVPPGTSGRNTLSQRANELNTTGMYSIMRNPLYAGNFIAILGVLICVKVWWLIVIFVPCYWLYIERVVAAEEVYLEEKFGDAYREWVSRVPAFLPRFAHWQPRTGPSHSHSCCGASTTGCWPSGRALLF